MEVQYLPINVVRTVEEMVVTGKTQESLEELCKTRHGKVRIGEGLVLNRETRRKSIAHPSPS